MSESGPQVPASNEGADPHLALDREKMAIDAKFREQELRLKVEDQARLAQELKLKADEARRSRWANPLVLAVAGAALATLGNGVVTWMNGSDQRALEDSRSQSAQRIQEDNNKQQLALENFKAESSRILEAIKTDNPDNAATNLRFLLDAGLITNKDTVAYLKNFLATRKPGQGPALPAPGASASGPRPSFGVSSAIVQQLAQSGNILGIDASHINGDIDFVAVQQHGVSFAYLRTTQATSVADQSAASNAQSAHNARLKVGLYHIYDPTTDVGGQIKNFEERLNTIQWDLPPAVDVADLGSKGKDKQDYAIQLKQFMAAIEAATGVKPVLYTTSSFAASYLDDSLHAYPLWLASYRKSAPVIPAGWSGYLLWQLADGVSDDPVLGRFDINVFKGSIDDLVVLGHRQ